MAAARTLFPPRGVVARQSTDTVAAESPEAQAALEMIRARACVTLGRYRREMRRG